MSEQVYGTSTVRRTRRTNAELETLDRAVYEELASDNPSTVRHTFYRMTVLGLVEKSQSGYRVVQREVLKLRRAGVIPYAWITDNTRWRVKPETHSSLGNALADMHEYYRRALWADQAVYVEVWCESDSVAGVINSVTGKWDVPLMTARGFSSEGYLYSSGEELASVGKPAFIYYFGDHDPSGLIIPEKIEAGLRRFAPLAEIHFERVAVLPEQIAAWSLPGKPPKATDTRSKSFAGECVEIEAIPARTLRAMVENCITRHVDDQQLAGTLAVEKQERETLSHVLRSLGLAA